MNTLLQRDNAADLVFNMIFAIIVSFYFYILSIPDQHILGVERNTAEAICIVTILIFATPLTYMAIKNFRIVGLINKEKHSIVYEINRAKNGNNAQEELNINLSKFKNYLKIIYEMQDDIIISITIQSIEIKSFWRPCNHFTFKIIIKDNKIHKVFEITQHGNNPLINP